ncbi:MAG TPA: glycosyltransferase family 2 protein [Pirellulaceae bacterium]|nr:glycosyltransferase family 2 protein [Pirellulaceae bacterium]
MNSRTGMTDKHCDSAVFLAIPNNVVFSMYELSLAFFWTFVGIAIHNTFWTAVILGVMRNRRSADVTPDDELPKAAILLCLRGADPSLPSCLRRLLCQDYPDYELFVCVDSKSDPAWDVVQSTILKLKARNIHVSPLRYRRSTCSLKCSSLVQLVDELNDSHEVIVLADADLESHPTWLRELVAPLADSRTGATFGNRWFLPAAACFGSLVRQLWNAPGLVVMNTLEIPWGGSLAIRSDVFRRGGLRDIWTRSIVDDGPVRTAVKAQDLKLRYIPSVTMANREECSLGSAYNFIRRQMTWTCTYVPLWWAALLIYSVACVGSWTAAVFLAVVCAFQGSLEAAAIFVAGATLLGTVSNVLWLILDLCVRRVIRGQGESASTVWSRQLIRLPIAMLVAGWVHVCAAVAATVRRKVIWRGVTYEIRGPSNIRLVDDLSLVNVGKTVEDSAALVTGKAA